MCVYIYGRNEEKLNTSFSFLVRCGYVLSQRDKTKEEGMKQRPEWRWWGQNGESRVNSIINNLMKTKGLRRKQIRNFAEL